MNFSLITDFGCPFNCSFCITNSQETKKIFSFSDKDFIDLKNEIRKHKIRRISLSGGGDPLYIHSDSIKDFYKKVFSFCKSEDIELHVHTNTMAPIETVKNFDKVVISINSLNFLKKYENWKNIKRKRFVHVSDGTDYDLIKKMLDNCPDDSQFTVKQMDNFDDELFLNIRRLLSDKKNAMFLQSGDYNLYYVLNEGKTYTRFKDIVFS